LQKYKASTGTQNDKAEVVKTMLGNIRTDADYKEFRDNVLTPAGISNAPQMRDSFDTWYAGGGYKEFNKQLDPTSPFTGSEYTDNTGAKKSDSGGGDTTNQNITVDNVMQVAQNFDPATTNVDDLEGKVVAGANGETKLDKPQLKSLLGALKTHPGMESQMQMNNGQIQITAGSELEGIINGSATPPNEPDPAE